MAGYTWADVGTKRLPLDMFVSFICHSPPGSALYHEYNQGWTVHDHLLTDILEVQDMLLWTKSKAAQSNKNRPKRRYRPGQENQKAANSKQVMTIAEYMKRTGMTSEVTSSRA